MKTVRCGLLDVALVQSNPELVESEPEVIEPESYVYTVVKCFSAIALIATCSLMIVL